MLFNIKNEYIHTDYMKNHRNFVRSKGEIKTCKLSFLWN